MMVQRKISHSCSTVEVPLFGNARSCYVHHLIEIRNLVKSCRAYLLSINLATLFTSIDLTTLKAVVDQHIPTYLSVRFDTPLYVYFETQHKKLREVARILFAVPELQNKFKVGLRRHPCMLQSENKAIVVFGNLLLLRNCVVTTQTTLEDHYSRLLDNHPRETERMLRELMQETRSFHRLEQLPNIDFQKFNALDVGQWLNDEIINYFIQKWCTESGTTLGLSTFFACKILFQQSDCINAKRGKISVEDEAEALRWCQKTEKRLRLQSWDAVFIPIHENHSHWYSAFIDFSRKRIEIYDSLWETCKNNRQKPLRMHKNTNLMLVLMWLTELLGQMRGVPIHLSNNPHTDWTFDSHTEVHFQPNLYDCGVHTLWHLRHILAFRWVTKNHEFCPDRLAFTDNMISKRLRLAQEILWDCQY